MQAAKINTLRKKLKESSPLIHSITNPISISKCAQAVLAVGARPMMAEHPFEVCEVAKTAGAVSLNIGNITDVRKKSIMKTAVFCYKNNIPFVYDAVGVACSTLRRKYTAKLLKKTSPTVIKGNYSEILAMYDSSYKAVGVDSERLDINYIEKAAAELSLKYGSIILASGKTDIITDGKRLCRIDNGTSMLGKITGTGCVAGVLCGCFLSVENSIYAPVTALAVLGISAELCKAKGQASFEAELFDNLSTLTDSDIEKHLKMEEVTL